MKRYRRCVPQASWKNGSRKTAFSVAYSFLKILKFRLFWTKTDEKVIVWRVYAWRRGLGRICPSKVSSPTTTHDPYSPCLRHLLLAVEVSKPSKYGRWKNIFISKFLTEFLEIFSICHLWLPNLENTSGTVLLFYRIDLFRFKGLLKWSIISPLQDGCVFYAFQTICQHYLHFSFHSTFCLSANYFLYRFLALTFS